MVISYARNGVSRILRDEEGKSDRLLGQGSPKEPGMGLVEAYEDAYFRRRKIVRITQKGSALMEKVVAAINNMRGA
jgi:hypothetical protein